MEHKKMKENMFKDLDLKPCPFCGSSAELFIVDTDPVYGDAWYFLGCTARVNNGHEHTCLGGALCNIEERELELYIENWNTRK
jgi:hypothetical protein